MEDPQQHHLPIMRDTLIGWTEKADEVRNHLRWLKTLKQTDILVYTDGWHGTDDLTASC